MRARSEQPRVVIFTRIEVTFCGCKLGIAHIAELGVSLRKIAISGGEVLGPGKACLKLSDGFSNVLRSAR